MQIENCPWCKHPVEVCEWRNEDRVSIHCTYCEASGPQSTREGVAHRRADVIAAWNSVAALRAEMEKAKELLVDARYLVKHLREWSEYADVGTEREDSWLARFDALSSSQPGEAAGGETTQTERKT